MNDTLRILSKQLDHILGVMYSGEETVLSEQDLFDFNQIISEFAYDITKNSRVNAGFDRAVAIRFILKKQRSKEELMKEYHRREKDFTETATDFTHRVQTFYDALKDRLKTSLDTINGTEIYEQYKQDAERIIRDKLHAFQIFNPGEPQFDQFVSDIFSNVTRTF